LKKITVNISDDLYKYISFLEKTHFARSKEEAVSTALEFYRRLSLHDWLPYTYRMGGGRVLIMDSTMLADLFHALTNRQIYNAARATAFKRKIVNPFFKDVDFSRPRNWSLVLKELEIMGWGKFRRFRNEIRVEFSVIPIPYLLGYFETMFGFEFKLHPSKIPNITVFIADKKKSMSLGEP
jgi:hypothetical protein